ncbi:MAG: nitroreductase family protein [Dehalococcoidales bacterium]|nr:nitroreductase family protein [Dehalococcoidales bacterium]
MDYENLLTVVKQRRSIRKYKPEPVPIESIMKVLEAARWAPSGRNSQPWEFIVVRSKDKLRQVTDIFLEQSQRLREKSLNFPTSRKDYLRKVSTLIVVCADPRFKPSYPQSQVSEQLATMYRENSERIYMQTIAAAICNILLAACSLGLGTVWLTGAGESITEQQLKEVLNIPQQLQTICCIPLGYPAAQRLSARCPRPLETMVHFDEFDVGKWRSDQDVERFVQDNRVRAKFYRTGRMP